MYPALRDPPTNPAQSVADSLVLSDPDPDARPTSSTLAGRFTIIHQLPGAPSEEHYVAQDAHSGLPVYVRVFAVDVHRDGPFRRRMREHGEGLRGLDHRHVERVLAYGDHLGHPFVVTDTVGGRRLSDLLTAGVAMPEVEVLRLIEQASLGLQEAAALGATHGSLGPSSLLVAFTNTAVGVGLADVEYVRVTGFIHPPALRLMSGSATADGFAYAAPEVVAGALGDERSDIYSLGAIMCRMLTGTPAAGANRLSTELAEPTRTIIQTAMARRSDQRFLNHNGMMVACAKAIRHLTGQTPRSLRVLRKPMLPTPPRLIDLGSPDDESSSRRRKTLMRSVSERQNAPAPAPNARGSGAASDMTTRIMRKHRNLKDTGHFTRRQERALGQPGTVAAAPPSPALEARAAESPKPSPEARRGVLWLLPLIALALAALLLALR
ncbi:MAG: hypothetical protein H0W72_13805 [Planctomycetes bacterium]|nr:hypothetical protein [Planctomycetota bacterium]